MDRASNSNRDETLDVVGMSSEVIVNSDESNSTSIACGTASVQQTGAQARVTGAAPETSTTRQTVFLGVQASPEMNGESAGRVFESVKISSSKSELANVPQAAARALFDRRSGSAASTDSTSTSAAGGTAPPMSQMATLFQQRLAELRSAEGKPLTSGLEKILVACAEPCVAPAGAYGNAGDDDSIYGVRAELLAFARCLNEERRQLDAERAEFYRSANVAARAERPKSRLPQFMGAVDDDFAQYRKNFEFEAALYKWSGGLAQNLLRMLGGFAREVAIDLSPEVRADYEQLCAALDRCFGGGYDRDAKIIALLDRFAPAPAEAPTAAFARLTALNNRLSDTLRLTPQALWEYRFVKLLADDKALHVRVRGASIDRRLELCEQYHTLGDPIWKRATVASAATQAATAALTSTGGSAYATQADLERLQRRLEAVEARMQYGPRRRGVRCFGCGGRHLQRHCTTSARSASSNWRVNGDERNTAEKTGEEGEEKGERSVLLDMIGEIRGLLKGMSANPQSTAGAERGAGAAAATEANGEVSVESSSRSVGAGGERVDTKGDQQQQQSSSSSSTTTVSIDGVNRDDYRSTAPSLASVSSESLGRSINSHHHRPVRVGAELSRVQLGNQSDRANVIAAQAHISTKNQRDDTTTIKGAQHQTTNYQHHQTRHRQTQYRNQYRPQYRQASQVSNTVRDHHRPVEPAWRRGMFSKEASRGRDAV